MVPKAAERWLRSTVRKAAALVAPGTSPPLQLRQVQVAHGVVYALLGVPVASARGWLHCSGQDSLFIRPFWTPSTGDAVARSNFQLIWLKGNLAAAPRLWTALRDMPGFYGLVADGRDLAIRVSMEADRTMIKAQVDLVVGNATLRTAEPGVRWWRLGPLTEAELWRVPDLITSLGLRLVRAELRRANLGPFRHAVFFPASGEPSRTTLDDGKWSSSEARLTPAAPPSRRKATTGAALALNSTWGGPRPSLPSAVQSPAALQHGPPAWEAVPTASVNTPTVGVGPPSPPILVGDVNVSPPQPTSVAFPALPPAAKGARGGRGSTRGRGGRQAARVEEPPLPTGPAVDKAADMSALLATLTHMSRQLEQMQREIQELHRANAELRLRAERAEGLQQHQPYSLTPLPPQPSYTYTPPKTAVDTHGRPASTLSPPPPGGSTSPSEADAKRPRRRLSLTAQDTGMEVDPDAPLPPTTVPPAATLSNDE